MTPFPLRRLPVAAGVSGALVAAAAAALLSAGTARGEASAGSASAPAAAPPAGEAASSPHDPGRPAGDDTGAAQHPSARALSTIALLDVTRVPPELLDLMQPGAEDGLTLLFLVVRDAAHGDAPPMRELRDFEVDRESYRERTKAKLGAPIEPLTIVEDVHDFLQRMSDDVPLGKVPPAGEAFLVITTIGGAKLPEDGRIAFEVEIAVDGATETVPFAFAVPPAGEEESALVPVVPDSPARRADGRPLLAL